MDQTSGLLEREAQFGALDEWFRDAIAGNGRMVFVGGEAGIGKSSLVSEFSQLVRGRARVLRGACDMLSTPRPLGPLLDFGAAVGGSFDRLLHSDTSRDRMFSATLIELSESMMPTVAVIEDAHWADDATLDLLRFLGRRLDDLRVMIIVTYRDDEVGPNHPLRVVLGDLATARTIRRMTLEPLSLDAVATLVGKCPDNASVDPAKLHELTGGNAFFVSEVLFSRTVAPGQIPTTVRDAVLARASRLSCPAGEVLDAAAVTGSPVSERMLHAVSGHPNEALEECLASGMLVLSGDREFSFRHELARVAIYDAILPIRRRELHAKTLQAFLEQEDSTQSAAILAHHADASGNGVAVVEFGIEAARRAVAMRAHREAAAQFARIVRYSSAMSDVDRAMMLEDYGYERFLTGEIEHAIELRGEALRIWQALGDRLREGNSYRSISRFSWYVGRNADAVTYAETAIAILETLPPGRELALALSNRSQLYMLASESEPAIAFGNAAKDLAKQIDDTGISIHAMINIGTAQLQLGHPEGRTTLEQSLELALEENLDDHATRAGINLAWFAVHYRDFEYAERALAQAIEYAADRDLDSCRFYMISCRSHLKLLSGDWNGALLDATSVLDKPRAAAVSRITALMVRGLVLARRGEPGAMDSLDEALMLAEGTGEIQRLRPVRTARAEMFWLSGDHKGCLAELEAVQKLAFTRGTSWDIGEVTLWAHRANAFDRMALPLIEDRLPEPYRSALHGDWRSSAASWEALCCPYDQALALLDGNERALREALGIFQQLGARSTEAVVARRLRQLGARGIPRGPRPKTRSNPANLTARELEILPFLAEGRQNLEIANRLFLSSKTVEHHVSSIFAKLGLRSRGEAGAAIARLGLELPVLQDRAAD